MSSGTISLPASADPVWKGVVASAANLPVSGNIQGDVRQALDTKTIYTWDGISSWVAVATPGAAIALDGLIGDLTATGPGVATGTLATVNSSVGSFGSASSVATFTVNAKGLTTAAASTSIQIAESQVTNLVSDLAGKQATGNYITALTGDVSASGPGSSAATLATVNSNVGTFTSPSVTVNGKGLITAISNGVLNVSTINTSTNAVSGTTYNCDTSGGAFNLTLPAPSSGLYIFVKDSTGSFQTNNLTVVRNGSEMIEGLAANKTLQTNWGFWRIYSNGTNWFIG